MGTLRQVRGAGLWALAGVVALAPAGRAQYAGRVGTKVDSAPVLRSIAVVEWTGEAGKPKASRLIPVSVFSDGSYQAGGLYLARPQPLALESGTEYELVRSGLPQGNYDVSSAERSFGEWLGYGAWKPLPPPAPVHRLKPQPIDADSSTGGNDRRPKFRRAAPDADAGGNPPAATPATDPGRPALTRRKPSADGTGDGNAGTKADDAVAAAGDPDRPRLTRSARRPETESRAHLDGMPADMQQIAGVSDATTRPEHSFAYSWTNPGDALTVQALLEAVALKAVSDTPAAPKPATRPRITPAHAPAHSPATRRAGAKTHVKTGAALTDVAFKAFELTYSGGATVVLSARTAGGEAQCQFVTIIAQIDIYGVPQVLFTHVTRAGELESSPEFRLIDAVDAAADNRGELLFELRGARTRTFALYRVAAGRVDQVLVTGALAMDGAAE